MMRLRWAVALLMVAACLPAHADPVTAIAIATQVAVYVGAISSTAAVIISTAAAIYGTVEARRKARAAAARARAAYNASLTDRTVTVLQADPPQRVIYGRARVGGTIVAMFTSDKQGTRTSGATYTKPDALKHLVMVFAAHQCQELHEVYIDGDAVGIASLDGNGWATTGEFASTQTMQREIQLAPGASTTAPAAVTVLSCVEVIVGGGDASPTDGTYTLSNANKTITNTSAFTVAVSFTYAVSVGSVRVSWHLGTDDQAADSYLSGVMGSQWPSTAKLSGLAYAVVTLDLENQRFQGGPPGITFDASGKLVYDPRANRANNPLCLGSVAGAPGTLPTGWSVALQSGLSREVGGSGIDEATGWPYVDLRITGGATATGNCSVNLQTAALAAAAAAGQQWSGRVGVRIMSATNPHTGIQAAIVSYNSGGAVSLEDTGTSISMSSGSGLQWAEVTDAALATGAVGAGVRLLVGVSNGVVYNSTIRILLPQLWRGAVGSAADAFHWSANNALCTADFLGSRQGMQVGYLDINEPALITAANACDVSISLTVDGVTTTGPTYTLNGSYTTDESLEGTLDAMCQSMAGTATYSADWIIQAGVWTPSVQTLTDADLDGQISIAQSGAAMDTLFNGINGSYLPAGAISQADAVYQNTTFVAADGEELWTDLSFPWSDNAARVRNLQRIFVERARAGLVISYPAKLTAWPLQVGDRVTVFSTEYGFLGKTFRVTDWGFSLTGAVVLTLQEDDASVWDLADAAVSDPTPNTNLPSPWVVSAPSGVSAASGTNHLQRLADGTVLPRVRVQWSAVTDAYVTDGGLVEICWRRAGQDQANLWRTINAPGSALAEYITGVRDGDTLNIAVTNINQLGRRSPTTYLSHVVIGKTAPPRDVTGFTLELIYGAVRITTDGNVDTDFACLELRRGASWAAGVPLAGSDPTRVSATEYLWAWPAYGTYTIWAKYIDTTGHYSTNAVSDTIIVNDAIKLGSDGVDVDLAGINLCRNSSFEFDLDADGLADGWVAYSAGSSGTITRSITTGRLTGNAQQVYTTALGNTSADRAGVRRDIPVGPGAIQQACISAWAWGSSGRTGRMLVYAMQGATVLDTQDVQLSFSGSNAWKRLQASFATFPAAADTVRVHLWISDGTGGSAVMVLDDVLVEEASIPSAWHPHPLEVVLGSDNLEDGAATGVWSTQVTGPVSVTDLSHTPNGYAYMTQVASITCTPYSAKPGNVDVLVTATFGYSASATSADDLRSYIGEGSNYDGWQVVVVDKVAAGGTASGTYQMTRRLTVPGNVSATFALWAQKTFSSTTYSISNLELRVEAIRK